MKVAIVGGGNIAHVHAPLVLNQSDVELVAVADRNIEQANAFAEEFKIKNVYEDPKDMIDKNKPDIVHVLIPPQFHAEVSILAMELGCNVLVEKPMALTLGDCDAMIEAARKNNVSLCVNHNGLRYGVYRRAIDMAKAGVIGDVVTLEAHEVYNAERNPSFIEEGAEQRHWAYRMNGGPLEDMMPHPAACVLEFIDHIEEVSTSAVCRGTFPGGWQDEIRVLVKSDKIIGYINASVSERPDIESLTIRGTKGILYADAFNDIITIRRLSNLSRKISRGISGFQLASQYLAGSLMNIFNVATGRMDKANGIGVVISEFYESVRNGKEPTIALDHSRRVVDLLNRIWPEPESAKISM
jgi:predicted dehydrogenase